MLALGIGSQPSDLAFATELSSSSEPRRGPAGATSATRAPVERGGGRRIARNVESAIGRSNGAARAAVWANKWHPICPYPAEVEWARGIPPSGSTVSPAVEDIDMDDKHSAGTSNQGGMSGSS